MINEFIQQKMKNLIINESVFITVSKRLNPVILHAEICAGILTEQGIEF